MICLGPRHALPAFQAEVYLEETEEFRIIHTYWNIDNGTRVRSEAERSLYPMKSNKSSQQEENGLISKTQIDPGLPRGTLRDN